MSHTTLKIPSTPSKIRDLETYVDKIAQQYDVNPDIYPNILISLTEAVNNAIIHGNNQDKNKYVDISLEENHNSLVFYISDEGDGFNPLEVIDPTADGRLDCCGGRGVFIMKELSDDISFDNDGRTVMIKFNL